MHWLTVYSNDRANISKQTDRPTGEINFTFASWLYRAYTASCLSCLPTLDDLSADIRL